MPTRFPLPGLLFALVALAIVHGPLLSTPPLFDEAPFLAGGSESRGAVVAMLWLPLELSWLGDDVGTHRVFGMALEAALVLLLAVSPFARRSSAPNLLLVALAAYLVHPFRTESFLRLGHRAVPVSELLLLSGLLLVAGEREPKQRKVAFTFGLVLVAAGASGMPLAIAFALPWLVAARGTSARAALATALALGVGVAAWWLAAPAAGPLASSPAGLDRMARPWTTGLVHRSADAAWACLGGALVLVPVLFQVSFKAAFKASFQDRKGVAAVVAALLAFAAAPALRPPRTGLELVGIGLTPEAWLAPLALVLFAFWNVAGGSMSSRLPLLGIGALAIGSGLVQARRFDGGEAKLIEHAIAVERDSVELRVARAERVLADAGRAPPAQREELAIEALKTAELALRRRPDDVPAATLKILALALSGKLEEARRQSDRLLEARPDDWRARATRADLEELAGDEFAALAWLRPALDANPSPSLRARYAALVDRIYDAIRADLAERRLEDARRKCERLVAVAPDEIEARTTWIDTFTLAGDLPRALDEAKKLHAERPRDRAIVQRLASLHEQLGHVDEAREYQRLLLALPAPSAEAERRRRDGR